GLSAPLISQPRVMIRPLPRPERAKVVRYHVAGEAQVNTDGMRRQRIIKACEVGDELALVREPNNPYDRDAVAIYTLSGQQVGYIPAEIASAVAESLDTGVQAPAYIAKILGGTRDKPNLGLVIDVHWPAPERPHRRRAVRVSD
ncbi:MAG: HIRAN domain-containing protein, partial [Chloroflexota bacterium]